MKIAVVGATGMVGEVMLQVLAERKFPVTELIPVASEKSVGKKMEWNGQTRWKRLEYNVLGYNLDWTATCRCGRRLPFLLW